MVERAELGPRKSAVLHAIVEEYVRSGEPVGSETIAERAGIGVSSATIRNEMAALEELGYLTHPHTSAGRIPTDIGYRHYVDSLPAGYLTYAPPTHVPRSLAFPTSPVSGDAVLLMTGHFVQCRPQTEVISLQDSHHQMMEMLEEIMGSLISGR